MLAAIVRHVRLARVPPCRRAAWTSSLPDKVRSGFGKRLAVYDALRVKLDEGQVRGKSAGDVSRALGDLEPSVQLIREIQEAEATRTELQEVLAGDDAELVELARLEMDDVDTRQTEVERRLVDHLLASQGDGQRNAIVEVRAGAGGQEAALFAAELFEMYRKFAQRHGWRFDVISKSQTDIGGVKEAVAGVEGRRVFGRLRFESGTHRVQRVPDTESQGRIHTSTASVAIMPEAVDVDVDIREADLQIDTYRSGGSGGQSVNTTDSAVRLTHKPTGIVVAMQDERSQHKNRAKAMRILRTRVYDLQQQERARDRAAQRSALVGTADRSERIRTYNFPQERVTDHRIGHSVHSVASMLNGELLDEMLDRLAEADSLESLNSLEMTTDDVDTDEA